MTKGLSFFVSWSAAALLTSAAATEPEVVYEWEQLDWTWDTTHTQADYLATSKFVPENCLLAGINVDYNGDIYLTVPRWRPGIPATLNKLDTVSQTLMPYPSWDMQQEGKEGDLQNTQSMTITSDRKMYAIEVGRRNFFDQTGQVDGAAGLWIIDLKTDLVLQTYSFPADVMSYSEGFLNDIVVDEVRQFAYFTDAWGAGAIITLDLSTMTSRRYAGASTANDPSYSMIINGQRYGKKIFTTPSDGLAMTADTEALFYCQVQGTTLYRLPTAALRNFTNNAASDVDALVQVLGQKQPSDGMKYVNGELFWGDLPDSALYRMAVDATSDTNTDTAPAVLAAEVNEETLEWVDTFAVDLSADGATASSSNALYFVSNRLDQYSVGTMDFTGAKGANMRILKYALE
jgi:hypothetical protein